MKRCGINPYQNQKSYQSYQKINMSNLIVASPDEGGVKRTTRVAED